ncbi:glycoside hydrolase family 36 N-terminal domain-containing protein [Lacticaseibacillus nasuensis]|uniref:glycoside hydrolase family 36 N-terminal domain-containing protein n=1 Tax=Lacticaseibacillus nasuensis TaxID=944671 RepID=UPI0006D18E5D|nr:glycoside hydrolase family 36 N-terminal domain-containing protein [Lacticaseibacillus nasuensis]
MISYDESTQVFHLANAAVSYLIHVLPTGNLEHVYYGPRLHQVPPLAQLTNRQWLNWTMHQDIDGEHWSNERLRQELPTAFGNDFREPALAVSRAGQPLVLQLQYQATRPRCRRTGAACRIRAKPRRR